MSFIVRIHAIQKCFVASFGMDREYIYFWQILRTELITWNLKNDSQEQRKSSKIFHKMVYRVTENMQSLQEIGSNPCFHILQRKMLPISSMQTRWYLLYESECCRQVWGLLNFSYGSKTQLLLVGSTIFLNTNSLPTDGMESMLSMVEKRRVFCHLQESGKTQYIQRWSQSHSSENLSSIPVNEETQSTIDHDWGEQVIHTLFSFLQ